ncbi:MAG: hypothetical protein M3437_09685 [Chloroflexota bacterium]|nr:hypothetical protein [Chloroflexota bacterium]MDQ5867723.1 hypothetical protein [Chloroflexota bacterium]
MFTPPNSNKATDLGNNSRLFLLACAPFAVTLLIAALVTLYLGSYVTPVPESAKTTPIYPGAMNVQSQGNSSLQVLSFTTSDSEDDVLAFYKDVLGKDRWVNPLTGDDYPPNVFEWHQGGINGPTDTAYRLTIEFEAGEDNQRNVQITVTKYDPR